jgi:hypothetical protein
MKKMTFPAIAAAAFLVAPALAGAQSPNPQTPPTSTPPATAPAPAPGAGVEQRADRATAKAETARGELVKVDADAKKITIKDAMGVETEYAYTDATEVAGGRDGVAGLATKSGSKVVVHFKSDMGTKTATKIEVSGDKKSS